MSLEPLTTTPIANGSNFFFKKKPFGSLQPPRPRRTSIPLDRRPGLLRPISSRSSKPIPSRACRRLNSIPLTPPPPSRLPPQTRPSQQDHIRRRFRRREPLTSPPSNTLNPRPRIPHNPLPRRRCAHRTTRRRRNRFPMVRRDALHAIHQRQCTPRLPRATGCTIRRPSSQDSIYPAPFCARRYLARVPASR